MWGSGREGSHETKFHFSPCKTVLSSKSFVQSETPGKPETTLMSGYGDIVFSLVSVLGLLTRHKGILKSLRENVNFKYGKNVQCFVMTKVKKGVEKLSVRIEYPVIVRRKPGLRHQTDGEEI